MNVLGRTLLIACPIFTLIVSSAQSMATAAPADAADLNPVTVKATTKHAPVSIVKAGKPVASIVVMGNAAGASDLQSFIKQATGAELPIVKEIVAPAIVLGDCPQAAALGLESSKLPVEGFAIRSTADAVHIVGKLSGRGADGQLWGGIEFLERFVGVRWYFPPAVEGGPQIGQSVPKTADLTVPPVWIEDTPAFQKRELWPPVSKSYSGSGIKMGVLHRFLRAGTSWPISLRVHQPNWPKNEELKKNRPGVYQLRKDGTRQHEVICYGHPDTLTTYLEGIQNSLDGKQPAYAPISGKAITVSPYDVELSCYCDHCRKLWDDKAGQYGGASKVMATFVDKLGREVKKRWPKEDLTIIYLPYLNYTTAPDGFQFPDNVEVQLCGMPGLAAYKEPAIREAEQANIDRWIKTTGRRIQNRHYCCWPAHKTKAAYQYPHAIKRFYQENRDKTVGTFINGTHNHWPRQHINLYCWLKVLWNPDFNVDAAVNEFAVRMFGSAAGTMRKLIELQCTAGRTVSGPAVDSPPRASTKSVSREKKLLRSRRCSPRHGRKQKATLS